MFVASYYRKNTYLWIKCRHLYNSTCKITFTVIAPLISYRILRPQKEYSIGSNPFSIAPNEPWYYKLQAQKASVWLRCKSLSTLYDIIS